MIDWTASVQRSYEYFIVDPGTWMDIKKVDTIKTSSITRDSTTETLGSASFTVGESIGECYVRTYMIANQNGVRERYPLGTFLLQTFPSSFNGCIKDITVDAYTPLLELKENPPPIGYYLPKGTNIMDAAYSIVRENARAPVSKPCCDKTLPYDFIANSDDTWLTYIIDLIGIADYELDLDELGRILFAPIQDIDSIKPVWTYTDDNSSILHPDISISNDLYKIPNVVEVIYSSDSEVYHVRAVNDDPNSPVSTVNRGRTITHRETNPSMSGIPDRARIEEYTQSLLKSLSSLSHTLSYTHGYCPVRMRDGVRLEYERSGLSGVNAKVISQTIDCTPECKVSETAVFNSKLWEG